MTMAKGLFRRCFHGIPKKKKLLVFIAIFGSVLLILPMIHVLTDQNISSNINLLFKPKSMHFDKITKKSNTIKVGVQNEIFFKPKLASDIPILNQEAPAAVLSLHNFSKKSFQKHFHDPKTSNWLFDQWKKQTSKQCEGKFVGYGNEIAILLNVTLDNMFLIGQKGGEDFKDLIAQKEDVEFFRFNNGYIKQTCPTVPIYKFNGNNHLNKIMSSYSVSAVSSVDEVENRTFIAITRYEYVNLYHTMTDFYNAFMVMAFFNLTQAETNILFIDGHPWGSLDSVWATLFSSIERAGRIQPRTTFKKLIFGSMGYDSPLFVGVGDKSIKTLPLSEEFREFFLTSYDVPVGKQLDCNKLQVLFVWRRPYIAHPRNPSGDVHRKIKNEDELLMTVRRLYPNWKVIGAQTDALPMKNQLELASGSDIMIGMHGAALSLSLLLPKHAALVELMPNYITPVWKEHFIVMAEWRGLIYKRWVNNNDTLELPDHTTIVPPVVILEFVSDIYQTLCSEPSR